MMMMMMIYNLHILDFSKMPSQTKYKRKNVENTSV